jgi:hypothetical protein
VGTVEGERTDAKERAWQLAIIIVLVVILVGLLLAVKEFVSTSPSTTTPGSGAPTKLAYSFQCCSDDFVHTVYHPGGKIALAWTTISQYSTTRSTPSLTVTAHLAGPFASVVTLKKTESTSHPAPQLVQLSSTPIVARAGTQKSPVSLIQIPSGAKTGYYNLSWTVNAKDGEIAGATVIHVSR